MKRSGWAKLLGLTFVLLLSFGAPAPVLAQSLVYGESVPKGTVVDQDIMLVGQNVTIDGTVNGNVFILGNQVVVNGTIDGSLILIGQNAVIGGTVSGGVYGAVLTLELNAPANLGRDLYVVTVSVVSQLNSTVQRDLFAITLDAGLNGQVGRNLHTAIGPIQLYNGLMQLLGFEELTIKLHFDFPPPPAGATPAPGSSQIPDIQHARLRLYRPATQDQPFDWGRWGINLARDWIVLSLLSLIALWPFRKFLDRSREPLQSRPVRTTAVGLLVLVISVSLFAVGALLAAMFFALGLGMNYLGLWQLSIALWIVVYSSLAMLLTALWFFISYATKIIVIYITFVWLLSKLRPSIGIKVAAVIVGALVYVLLRSTPYIGWVIDVLITAAGLGTAWLAYRAVQLASRQPSMNISEPVLATTARAARPNRIK